MSTHNEDTLLPFSADKQRAVLGHCLATPEFSESALAVLSGSWFADPVAGKVFEATKAWHSKFGSLPSVAELGESEFTRKMDPLTAGQFRVLSAVAVDSRSQFQVAPLQEEISTWVRCRKLQLGVPKLVEKYNKQDLDGAAIALRDLAADYDSCVVSGRDPIFGMSVEELGEMADALPPETWVIPDMVPGRGFLLEVAEPNAGKTWLALYIAREAQKQGRQVLMVEEEGGVQGLVWRTRQMKISGISITHNKQVKLDNASHVQKLCKWVKEATRPVVILDPLASLHAGDENNAQEMTVVIQAIQQIKNSNPECLVVVCHHSNKSTNGSDMYRARGTSALPGAADSLLLLTGVAQPEGSGRVAMSVNITKLRDGAKGFSRDITIHLDGSGTVDISRSECSSKEASVSDAILAVMASAPPEGFNKSSIRTLVGKSNSTVVAIVDKMVEQGVLVKCGNKSFKLAEKKES